MEWVIWVIVIVLIIAIVWWLMSRGNTQNAARTAGRVEHRGAVPPADSVAKVPDQAPLAGGGIAATAEAVGTAGVGMPGFTSSAAAAAAEGSSPARPDEDEEATEETSAATRAAMTADEPVTDEEPVTAEGPVRERPVATDTSEPETTPEDAFIAEQLATADEPGSVGAAGGDVDDWESSAAAGSATTEAPGSEARADEAGEGMTVEDAGVTADDVVPADPGPGVTAGKSPEDVAADKAEWEATWSEASPAPAQAAAPVHHTGPVHHHEYTGEHAPTLPGAESAAAESLAAGDTAVAQDTDRGGHLAAEQPYGEGSAAPGPDGNGPEGYTVKGDATSMTYYDEDSPAYEEATVEVWFLSAAHAEAAGFRPPRRNRH